MDKAGDIFLKKYAGWYSVRDEAYYDESETVLGDDGVRRPAHGARLEDRRVGADHALGLEAVDPPLDRGRAQRDASADVLERAARVLAQQGNDPPVGIVHTRARYRFHATDRH